MTRPSLTIAQVMTLTALVAVDLAMIPFEMWFLLMVPVCLAMYVSLNVVIVQAFVLGRPLEAFHYTFIIAAAVASIVITGLMFWAGYSEDDGSLGAWGGACLLTLLLAWGSGLLVSRRSARRRQRAGERDRTTAALVVQGALIGFGFFVIGTTLFFGAGLGPDEWHPERWTAYYAGLLASPAIGAVALWFSVRWTRRAPQTARITEAPDPLRTG